MNGIDWLARRIIAAANEALENDKGARYNPRPPGVIRPDSATHAVLDFLRRHPGLWFQRDQIVLATGRTAKAVDWALLFLRAQQRVRTNEDAARNARYLRYSIALEGKERAGAS